MKLKTIGTAIGMGVSVMMTAVGEPLLGKDRPVDAEDVPELLMKLKDPTNAEEEMILEVLGLIKGPDGELKAVKGDDLFEGAGEGGDVKIRKKIRVFRGGDAEDARVELKVLPAGEEIEVEGLSLGGKGGVLRVDLDPAADSAMKLEDAKKLLEMLERQNARMRTELKPAAPVPAKGETRWMIGAVIDVNEKGSLVVGRMLEDGPAEKGGLKEEDVLLGLNGIKLRDFAMLVELIQLVQDQPVYFVVQRGDGKKKVKVKATKRSALLGERVEPAEQVEELEEEKMKKPSKAEKRSGDSEVRKPRPSLPRERVEKLKEEIEEKVQERRAIDRRAKLQPAQARRPVWDGRMEREIRALQEEMKRLRKRVEELERP